MSIISLLQQALVQIVRRHEASHRPQIPMPNHDAQVLAHVLRVCKTLPDSQHPPRLDCVYADPNKKLPHTSHQVSLSPPPSLFVVLPVAAPAPLAFSDSFKNSLRESLSNVFVCLAAAFLACLESARGTSCGFEGDGPLPELEDESEDEDDML